MRKFSSSHQGSSMVKRPKPHPIPVSLGPWRKRMKGPQTKVRVPGQGSQERNCLAWKTKFWEPPGQRAPTNSSAQSGFDPRTVALTRGAGVLEGERMPWPAFFQATQLQLWMEMGGRIQTWGWCQSSYRHGELVCTCKMVLGGEGRSGRKLSLGFPKQVLPDESLAWERTPSGVNAPLLLDPDSP